VRGLAAHAGTKYFGVSAIEKALKIIKALHDLEAIRERQFRTRFFKSYPIAFPLNVGTIKGGDWPSTVPERVQFEARLGLGPGEDAATARKQVEDFISRVSSLDPWMVGCPPTIEWFGNQCKGFQIDPEHPLVRSVLSAATEQLGGDREPEAVRWGTDGSTLVNVAGVPTVVFGPGTMRVAHMVDEYVEVQRLVDSCKIIACSMLDWCQVA
jgi:acetylornithine deacetylase